MYSIKVYPYILVVNMMVDSSQSSGPFPWDTDSVELYQQEGRFSQRVATHSGK